MNLLKTPNNALVRTQTTLRLRRTASTLDDEENNDKKSRIN